MAGNRNPVSRVAGENSTTEPTMRGNLGFSARVVGDHVTMALIWKVPIFVIDVTKSEKSTLPIKKKAYSILSRPVSSVG